MIQNNKIYKIKNEASFYKFLDEANFFRFDWASGKNALDKETVQVFAKRQYPFQIEISCGVLYYSPVPSAKAIWYEPSSNVHEVKPVNFIDNQRSQPGIHIVMEDGREFFYDSKTYFNDPNKFMSYMKSLSAPKVGDIVQIVDEGKIYSTYPVWFKENNVDAEIAAAYAFKVEGPIDKKVKYTVKATGPHSCGDRILCAIKPITQDPWLEYIYLIASEGVQKVQ